MFNSLTKSKYSLKSSFKEHNNQEVMIQQWYVPLVGYIKNHPTIIQAVWNVAVYDNTAKHENDSH